MLYEIGIQPKVYDTEYGEIRKSVIMYAPKLRSETSAQLRQGLRREVWVDNKSYSDSGHLNQTDCG